jgi:hypothetical protein
LFCPLSPEAYLLTGKAMGVNYNCICHAERLKHLFCDRHVEEDPSFLRMTGFYISTEAVLLTGRKNSVFNY